MILCKLKVELRGDDCKAGWVQLFRHAQTIEAVSIRLLDRSQGPGPPYSYDPQYVWQIGFGPHSLVRHQVSPYTPGYFTLPNVTSLQLYATYQVLEHFTYAIPCFPNIQVLSLSYIGAGTEDNCYMLEEAMWNGLKKLERVSCYLPKGLMANFCNNLQDCEIVRFLTINIHSEPDESTPLYLPDYASLEGLCLLGARVEYVLGARGWDNGRHGDCFRRVITLALERQAANSHGECIYPLLDTSIRPNFISMERLIFIDRTGSTENIAENKLKDLFAQYGTLQQIEFIVAPSYPADPFADGPPSTWAERNVQCFVPRPAANGPLQMLR